MDQLIGIKTGVLSNSDGELPQSLSIGIDSKRLFSLDSLGQSLACNGHDELGVASTIDDLLVLDSLDKHAKGVMKRSLGLVENVLTGSSEDNSAGFVSLAS